jgi:hypothetical protein
MKTLKQNKRTQRSRINYKDVRSEGEHCQLTAQLGVLAMQAGQARLSNNELIVVEF